MPRNRRDDTTESHLDILLGGTQVGDIDFLPLYRKCVQRSRTPIPGWKRLRRAQRAFNLLRYFRHSLDIEGSSAECGVLAGLTALLMAHVARDHLPGWQGKDLHLIDSFEGLSQPTAKDAVQTKEAPNGSVEHVYSRKAGDLNSPLEWVQSVMIDFPDTRFHKGWIPEVFVLLPNVPWAFVHIDVDLYEPTLRSLEYFWPRLASGGIAVNDDYRSSGFPGAHYAWNEFCQERGITFTALDTGQAVLIKR